MTEHAMEYLAIVLTNGWELLQNTASESLLAFFHPHTGEVFIVNNFFETGDIVFRAKINEDDTVTILVLDDSVLSFVDYEEKQIRVDEVEVFAELEDEDEDEYIFN
ncbi:hypothetical protein [Bacillus massiliigorillae]|uniref:hypothetical protein n=1 Tax=Bacillus massiliigorillae TaxID=1243664 RepID=UPI00039D58DF|nr:hypothetical protein [Bacillus massiliigorillae]